MSETEKTAAKISDADKTRFKELFDSLDVNQDGQIEVSELAKALAKQKGVSEKELLGHAQDIIDKADEDADKEIDFTEFVKYMSEHERKLRLAFSDLDKNKDGKIEPVEVKAALHKLGLTIDLKEAESLTKKIDKDGSLSVDWDEWRTFFQMASSSEMEHLIAHWRSSPMIDIGESLTVPPEFTKQERKTGMWWRHLVAGGLAGAVSRTCTAPLDRIKIMFQVHGASQSNKGVVGMLQQMIREGGVRSLWRGNGTNVLKIAPESAIKFAAYEQIKKALVGDRPIGLIERFAAGSSAGAFAQTCIYPLEVIKTRLAVSQTGQYKGILDCGAQILKKEGGRALFKGYLPNLVGIIPYAGIDLSIYETLKQMHIARNPQNPDPGILTLLACGTVSSTCGQLASYPLALVRTRLQAQVASEKSVGFVTMLKNIVQNEGLPGLYRGILPNFMKVLPAVSISYVIYERVKSQLGIHK